MKAAGITTWFQFTQGQCLFCHGGEKEWQNSLRLFCRFGHYFVVDLVIILRQFGKYMLPHLHVYVTVYFAQILKILPEQWPIFQHWGCDRIPCIPIPYVYAVPHACHPRNFLFMAFFWKKNEKTFQTL